MKKILKWSDFKNSSKINEKKKTSYEESGLEQPKKADLNKDKKISEYEKKRGSAIDKAIKIAKEKMAKKKKK